jgi:hypothetical protein
MAAYCTKNEAGLCGVCGIPYADDKYARECHPLSFLLDQHSHSVSGNHLPPAPAAEQMPTHGPGTELKKLLGRVGITATPDCSCNARAAEMDRQGVEWCEANLDTIVGWLREQATARGLPFLDVAGRMLVRRAISNARRNA